MKDKIHYTLVLGVICLLASGVLAVVNAITEPEIARQKKKTEQEALRDVLQEAGDFKAVFKDGELNYYNAYDSSNRLAGFVLKAAGRGYSSVIETFAGVDINLKIVNIKVLSQNETPGLGSRVTEPAFGEQFRGRGLDSYGEIQAITGATISSGAVINSLKEKLEQLKPQLLKEIESAG